MLGIPTWFLTLSAPDVHWPEMIQAVAVQFGKILTQKDVLKMSNADRSTYFFLVLGFTVDLSLWFLLTISVKGLP